MNIKEIVGNNLRALRNAANLSNQDFSEKLNKDTSTVSRYETGQREMDYETILNVCQVLSITPNNLFKYLIKEE